MNDDAEQAQVIERAVTFEFMPQVNIIGQQR